MRPLLVIVLLSFASLVACGRLTSPAPPPPPGCVFVNAQGVHTLSSSLVLQVSIAGDDTVVAMLMSPDGRTFVIDSGLSKFHLWYYYWDGPRGELWRYSGDIGTECWWKPAERWEQRDLAWPAEGFKAMPDYMFALLSPHRQESYREYREPVPTPTD
jgi:hypothetical protein